MPTSAKVYANVFSRIRGSFPGSIAFVIEFVVLSGAQRSGKKTVTLNLLRSESNAQELLKDALAEYLTDLYAPEVFTSRDIVGCSV